MISDHGVNKTVYGSILSRPRLQMHVKQHGSGAQQQQQAIGPRGSAYRERERERERVLIHIAVSWRQIVHAASRRRRAVAALFRNIPPQPFFLRSSSSVCRRSLFERCSVHYLLQLQQPRLPPRPLQPSAAYASCALTSLTAGDVRRRTALIKAGRCEQESQICTYMASSEKHLQSVR